jgi:hypothetical protein
MWFLTGVGMIYSRGMPRLTAPARLARLPVLDLERIHIKPSEAVERAELGFSPDRAQMLMVMNRPAYRFNAGGQVTVFADTGELLEEVGPAEAVTIASRFMNVSEDKVHYLGLITEPDQWTLTQGRQIPLHKLTVDDASHTDLYVSPRSAEVAVLTTRSSRALAWVSTNPHWLYFAALRSNSDLGWNVVVWTSGIGCILALFGIVIGVVQFRYRRPVKLPYSGLMKWHYALGIDPEVNQIVGQVQRNNRIERWLYNGLHSLDFSFWYYKRPLWDIGVIILSLGGAALSGIGVIMGFKRFWRAVKRSVKSRRRSAEVAEIM